MHAPRIALQAVLILTTFVASASALHVQCATDAKADQSEHVSWAWKESGEVRHQGLMRNPGTPCMFRNTPVGTALANSLSGGRNHALTAYLDRPRPITRAHT